MPDTLTLSASITTEVTVKKRIEVFESDSRKRQYRIKSNGIRFYQIKPQLPSLADYNSLLSFWSTHWPNVEFNWTDPWLAQLNTFYFDSPISTEVTLFDILKHGFSMREKSSSRTGALMPSNSFPYTPNYGYQMDDERQALVHDASDLSRVSRGKGAQLKHYNWKFNDRSVSEYLTLELYWEKYYPGRTFTYLDWVLSQTKTYEIDSDLKWSPNENGGIDYSFVVREAA